MPRQFIVTPPYEADVEVGPEGARNQVNIGRLGERGPLRSVRFNAGREFVLLILGKRGSGKSYTLGSLLEGFCTKENTTSLSTLTTRPGILLLDPMMNFWPSVIPVTNDGSEKVRAQHRLLEGWDCKAEESNIVVWLPQGYRREFDYPNINDFSVRTSDLDPQDWADVAGVNLVRDPQGMLLGEILELVTVQGWSDSDGRTYRANPAFELRDLILCIERGRAPYHREEVARALTRTLESWDRHGLFRRCGTATADLVKPGVLSILMLPQRIGHDLRRVLSRVLIRRLLKEREAASQIRQRLDVQKLENSERQLLEQRLSSLAPKTILALDEAQELLGEDGGEAKEALEDFCLLGRNYGLSLILATQRPTTGAISSKVRAQVDTYFIHRLLTQEDIDLSERNLISLMPDEVRFGNHSLDYGKVLRSLETGQCLVTSDRISSKDTRTRSFIMNVRPRTRVHGGEVS
jgi:hypothetical protein